MEARGDSGLQDREKQARALRITFLQCFVAKRKVLGSLSRRAETHICLKLLMKMAPPWLTFLSCPINLKFAWRGGFQKANKSEECLPSGFTTESRRPGQGSQTLWHSEDKVCPCARQGRNRHYSAHDQQSSPGLRDDWARNQSER